MNVEIFKTVRTKISTTKSLNCKATMYLKKKKKQQQPHKKQLIFIGRDIDKDLPLNHSPDAHSRPEQELEAPSPPPSCMEAIQGLKASPASKRLDQKSRSLCSNQRLQCGVWMFSLGGLLAALNTCLYFFSLYGTKHRLERCELENKLLLIQQQKFLNHLLPWFLHGK